MHVVCVNVLILSGSTILRMNGKVSVDHPPSKIVWYLPVFVGILVFTWYLLGIYTVDWYCIILFVRLWRTAISVVNFALCNIFRVV